MVEVYHTTLPGWAVLIAAIVPGFYMIPCGIIQGITNVDANQLNVLSEFVGGYIFNGRPLANMIFKILSTDVVGQGLYFAADMKLGHYMKIPPRTLFFAQGSATILGALTQTGVTLWMLGNVKDICSSDQYVKLSPLLSQILRTDLFGVFFGSRFLNNLRLFLKTNTDLSIDQTASPVPTAEPHFPPP